MEVRFDLTNNVHEKLLGILEANDMKMEEYLNELVTNDVMLHYYEDMNTLMDKVREESVLVQVKNESNKTDENEKIDNAGVVQPIEDKRPEDAPRPMEKRKRILK